MPMSVAIELFMHTCVNRPVLGYTCGIRPTIILIPDRVTLPGNLVKHRTPGDPNLRKEN